MPVAAIKHHNWQQLGEARVCLAYTLFIIKGSQDRSSRVLEAGADAEAMEESC